ncbi:hypothetical protein BOTNAR_0617g00040 [Botryotinia narcissicola]|uniref:Uncharacterized protein n=1 Tax=Botryotinia narcissicola TaxID=278944 RepID=A0A4Z1HFG4_9HELO|nr:hypothetical protein BOTNAR_0617g00040 [Botryotinia narcissicola]
MHFNDLLDRSSLSTASNFNAEGSMDAPQIRACTNCVRAKAKCSSAPDGEVWILYYEKTMSTVAIYARHRAIKKPPHHETSKLEAKLDDLVTLLKSNTQVTPIKINSGFKTITEPAARAVCKRYKDRRSSTSGSGVDNTPTSSPSNTASLDTFSLQSSYSLSFEPNEKDAELFLNRFRDKNYGSTSGNPGLYCLLSISMLYNLGLDKPPSGDPAVMLAYDLKGCGKPARLSRVPTNEERRALSGCYLLSSVSCYTLRKGNTLRWTSYSDECLKSLETEKELGTDAILVQLGKLRLITTRINGLPWSGGLSVDSVVKAPVSFYLKSLESQLQGLKKKISEYLTNNGEFFRTLTLGLELHTTERSIYEIDLLQVHDVLHGQENRRAEYLWACINATNAWINVFLSISPAEYISFSALTYSNMTHFFLSAYYLTTLDNTDYNQTPCIEHLDFPSFLDQAGRNFARVKEMAGLDVSPEYPDAFSIMSNRSRVLEMSWDVSHGVAAESLADFSKLDNHELYDFSIEFSDGDLLKNLLDSHDEQLQWDQ